MTGSRLLGLRYRSDYITRLIRELVTELADDLFDCPQWRGAAERLFSRGGLIKRGLGCDAPNVGVVLNVREDHLGSDGVTTLEEMADVKVLVAKSARDWVVLNAEDALCVAMAEGLMAKVCYVSYTKNNQLVLNHLAAGGVAVLLDSEAKNQEILLKNSENTLLINATDIPATFNGNAIHNSINAAFAAAAAWCMGCSAEQIKKGLQNFSCDYENARGRMNIYDKHPFTVVMDSAATPDKLAALVAWVNITKEGRRCIGVLTSPGNRLVDHFDQLAAQAADCFDQFICSPWGEDYRGRGPLEVQHLIREGLIKSGLSEDRITIADTEPQAVQKALETAEKEDLVVICTKSHERTWGHIVSFS